MDQRLLVEVVANAFMSDDHASDAEVDPDWAVKVAEGLAATLNRLPAEDRVEFRLELEALASQLEGDPFHDAWRDYYRGLPNALGWE